MIDKPYHEVYRKNWLKDGHGQVRGVLERVRAPRRITMSQACREYMRISTPGGYDGPWSSDVAPYMVEPMDSSVSRDYEAVVFVGVAQSGKTASLAEGAITYSVVVDPSDCTLIMPSQDSARDFSKRRLDRLIRNSPELRSRVLGGQDDNVLDKITTSGAIVTLGWPTVSQLASKNIKRIILSDLDRMPSDIGGEGDPFSLARKRTQSFMSAGKVIAESTPSYFVSDADWKPSSPDSHAPPPVAGGILQLYAQGTMERWYWTCPHCKELFRAEMQHFRWDDLLDASDAAATAHMICPECGGVIDESHKAALNLAGQWLADGWREGNQKAARIRSFWMQGVAAAFQRWSSLAYNMIVARREFADSGGTERLKVVTNVDWGLPFTNPGSLSERSSTALQAMSEHYPIGIVPPEGRFLVASVDMQINRFVLQVVAHGKSNERWLVDRRNITESPRLLEDGSKARVEPFNHAEDFSALLPILTELKYPHASGGHMPVRVMAMDTGGKDEASVNAYAFWRKAAGLGLAEKLMLVKGNGLPTAKRLNRSTAQKVDGVPLWIIGTNIFKTEVAFDLIRQDPGPGKIHTSSELQSWFFDELASEEQDASTGKWFKKNAKGRNEAFDLFVYDAAAYVAIGGEGLQFDDESKLPIWAKFRIPEKKEADLSDQSVIQPQKTQADSEISKGGIDWAAIGRQMNG